MIQCSVMPMHVVCNGFNIGVFTKMFTCSFTYDKISPLPVSPGISSLNEVSVHLNFLSWSINWFIASSCLMSSAQLFLMRCCEISSGRQEFSSKHWMNLTGPSASMGLQLSWRRSTWGGVATGLGWNGLSQNGYWLAHLMHISPFRKHVSEALNGK